MKATIPKSLAWLIGLVGFAAIPASAMAQSKVNSGIILAIAGVCVGILGSRLSRDGSRVASLLCLVVAIIVGAAGVVQVIEVYRS
jgi:hypothetical protein